jgi:hypothetical protein
VWKLSQYAIIGYFLWANERYSWGVSGYAAGVVGIFVCYLVAGVVNRLWHFWCGVPPPTAAVHWLRAAAAHANNRSGAQ